MKIELNDNGRGMNMEGLHSFFDLRNSMSRGNKEKIGEKGHGTKVYLNSTRISIETQREKKHYYAVINEPKKTLNLIFVEEKKLKLLS